MKRPVQCPDPVELRSTRRVLADRFIPSKVRKTHFEMHEEVVMYTNTRNVCPTNDIEILPRLFLERVLPDVSVYSQSGQKNVLQMNDIPSCESMESLDLRRQGSSRLYSYHTKPTCVLYSNQSLVNSNASILDYTKAGTMLLTQGQSVFSYDLALNRTTEAYFSPSSIYAIRANDFSDSFVGLAMRNGEFEIGDLNRKIPLRSYHGITPADKVTAIDWVSDGVINGTSMGNVLVRDVRAKGDERVTTSQHKGKITCVRANRFNEMLVLSADTEGVVSVSDRRRGVLGMFLGHEKSVRSVAWSNSDASAFISGGKFDGKLMAWNLNARNPLTKIDLSASAYNVDYTAEGNYLVSCGGPNFDLRVFDQSDSRTIVSFQEHQSPVYHMVVNCDRSLAVSCSQDGKINFWDLKNHLEGREVAKAAPQISLMR